MKKTIFLFAFSIIVLNVFAQNNSNSILIRHDTATLKVGDCEWIIKSLAKNDPSLNAEIGKSLPQFLLDGIQKGKIKAFDANTNTPITAKKILTWQMPVDSIMTMDESGNSKLGTIQREHSSDNIDEVRIYNDWYLDVATGKLKSVIKWIELREKIHSSMGDFLGYAAFCRIYY